LAVFFFLYAARVSSFSNTLTIVALTNPSNGAVLPLHGTFSVNAEAASRRKIQELQLMVNGQPWGSKAYETAMPAARAYWQWTPSGEGTHELFVRAIDAEGRVHESNHIRVMAMASADARFPLQYAAVEGDTVDRLAESMEVSPQEILDANPGLDPQAPIPGGQPLTIPVHVPNAEPVEPESGAEPAPPVEPPPQTGDNPLAIITTGIHLTTGQSGDKDSSGFLFADGKIIPDQMVEKLYLYYSLNGEIPWRRIPEEPMTFLSPQAGGFDLSGYLPLAQLEASPQTVSLDAEAWGWQGGSLIFLGSYHGTIGGGLRAWPPQDTILKIVAYETVGIPKYVYEMDLAGENPTLEVEFDWSTTSPSATYARWQVSSEPFTGDVSFFPSGLVQQGTEKAPQGRFKINFSEYFQSQNMWDQLNTDVGDIFGFIEGKEKPAKTFWPVLPMTFYVRIVPLNDGSVPLSLEPTGSTSNTVIVRYLPSGEVLAETATPGGPVYQAQIAEYVPYRAADPLYKSCVVLVQDIKVGEDTIMPAGTQGCGCPGVSCSGGSSCSIDPSDWDTCAADAVNAAAGAFTGLVDFAAGLYNGAKQWVVDTLSSGLCDEEFLGSVIPPDECKVLVEIGVNAGLAALGLPPEIPNFEALFNEGLEYAVASLAAQITGFECNETCRDLLKKAYQGASDPEQIYKEGLKYGASLAAEELADMDIECDLKCKSLIEAAAEGEINTQGLTDEALAAMAKEAAAELKKQGYACEAECENAILDSYKKGNSLGKTAASTASQPPPRPFWLPHPQALEQPSIVKVEIFRRWESAQLSSETIAERCTGFSVDNLAVNSSYSSMQLSGRVFEPRAVDVPLIEPGGSLLIPIVLRPASWSLPPGFSDPVASEILGYQSLGEEDGQQLGQVQQGQTVVSFQSQWRVLYHGSQLELKILGPYMLDEVDGKAMGFPCFSAEKETFSVPMP
jgi:hypothetical protein